VFTCSCSNNGQLWVVVSSGSVLVRNGITREKPYGTGWHLSIDMPGNDQIISGVKQLAIGSDMAWALTSQGCVFYRKGITGVHSPTGSKWIDVPGDMLCISVTEQNQVRCCLSLSCIFGCIQQSYKHRCESRSCGRLTRTGICAIGKTLSLMVA
jgi:hypothetical protein